MALTLSLVAYFVLHSVYTYLDTPPHDFPIGVEVTIPEGTLQNDATDTLKDAGMVRSALLLHIQLTRSFSGKYVKAGIYTFPHALTSHEIADALITGAYMSPALKLTLPEGFSVSNFAEYFPNTYTRYETRDLSDLEGRLFPDTYYISNAQSMDEIITMLTSTMQERLRAYEDAIAQSGFSEDEVIILASILEREANDEESMRRVSGILQNRLAINMPLQVDATFDYILGKTSEELTMDDLKIDSPYNTYLYRGLPPAPIANPGIQAIEAVLYPIPSDDLYYLTGNDGVFYYAETHDEHVRNKDRYLR
jgi:UPF0755 protein